MHPITVGGNGIVVQVYHIFLIRHGPDPTFLLVVVPGIPVHLITAESSACGHGQAHPIQIGLFPDPLKGAFYVLCGHCVLGLEILVEHADSSVGIMFFPVVQHQIQQQTAVLSPGKGDVDVLKLFKDQFQAGLKPFIYIAFLVFP